MYYIVAGAGAAILGAYTAYTRYNQVAVITQPEIAPLKPIRPEPTLQANLIELIDATENEKLISQRDKLIEALLSSDTNHSKQQDAWQQIIKALNPEYYVARDNTTKFLKVQPHITALSAVVLAAVADLDGKLENNPTLAADVVQFIFKVSNYYSIASTLDANNFDLCTQWLFKAHDFIFNNGLKDTLQHAIWHNLIGGHKSREYQMGRNTARPSEAVTHFKNAVSIHKDKLGSNLDNPMDIELRHVQMCLSGTTLQDAMWCIVNDEKMSEEVNESINNAKYLLGELTEKRLVLKDGKPDLYRLAGCLQSQAYVLMLEGDFNGAIEKMSVASNTMKQAIGSTGATGQLSAILNDEAGALLAIATVKYPQEARYYVENAETCLKQSIALSEGQFEQMYADNAKAMLDQIACDPANSFYSKLAVFVSKSAPDKSATTRLVMS